MGFKRVLGSGIFGMFILLIMAIVSVSFFGLSSNITRGLLIVSSNIVLQAIVGISMLCVFPIHWALISYPNDIPLMLSIVLPWILTCAIASALFAHSPRGGFDTSIAIGIGYLILFSIGYFFVDALITRIFNVSIDFRGILDAIMTGFTGMPYLLSVLAATMEGALIGGIFGAFIGSLKYKPGGVDVKKSKEKKVRAEPTLDSMGGYGSEIKEDVFCTNCGAKIRPGDEFCVNCGAKVK